MTIELSPCGVDELQSLVGKEYDFHGVDNHCFKLDDMIFEAIEDESDGYRSYLESVRRHDSWKRNFFATPIARVVVVEDNVSHSPRRKHPPTDDSCYVLRDVADGHVWLRFGTENLDDYYPYFVFEYQPKRPASAR